MIPDGLTQVGVEVSKFPLFFAAAALAAVVCAFFARKFRSDPRKFQDLVVLTFVAPGALIGVGHLTDHGAELPGIYETRGKITHVRPLDTSGRQAVWVDSLENAVVTTDFDYTRIIGHEVTFECRVTPTGMHDPSVTCALVDLHDSECSVAEIQRVMEPFGAIMRFDLACPARPGEELVLHDDPWSAF